MNGRFNEIINMHLKTFLPFMLLATGPLGVVRLYLPTDKDPVQMDWVKLQSNGGKSQRWYF